MSRIVLLSIAALSSAAIVACAKDAAKSDTAKVAQAGAAAAPASRATFDVATHVATVYAKDYAFEVPDTISGGLTTFHLVNDGKTLHHVQLVRLDSGKTVSDLEAAMKNPGPPPAWALFVGGTNSPDPGGSADATVDVAPGNYAVLCLVDIPDNMPHFMKGMVHGLVVTAPAGTPMATPKADVNLTLSDYAFTVAGPLTGGKHTLAIKNGGPQLHELELVRFAPGKGMKDLAAWVAKPDGPPPANAIGGIPAIPPGSTSYVSFDLTPGHYAMLCFLPDAKDGKRHLEHGMIKEFEVQ